MTKFLGMLTLLIAVVSVIAVYADQVIRFGLLVLMLLLVFQAGFMLFNRF